MTKKKLLVFEGAEIEQLREFINELTNDKKKVIVTNLKTKVIVLEV